MMEKTPERRSRPLKELYNVTKKINEPEITPVLKGSCRIQGPVEDEIEPLSITKKNTGSSQDEKRSGRRSLKEKGGIKAESGTCNVCAAPCSSCMHFKRGRPRRGLKLEEEFSNEVFSGKEDTQCSLNDAKLKDRACKNQNSIPNETSNLVSPSSSHDSFSENAESKASVDVFTRVSVGGAVCHNQYDEQKVLEGDGDDMSCVSGANGANMPVGDVSVDVNRKLCSAASLSSGSPEGSENIDIQSPPGCLAGLHLENVNKIIEPSRTNTLSEESAMKDCTVISEKVGAVETGNPPGESLKCLDSNEQIGKSTVSPELPNTRDPLESQPVDEGDGSDIVEDDVKVCDICGDAGREDSLAICSRCSDGAEHIYCMQKMMDKLPEKDWVCEGCQLKVDADKEKQDWNEKSDSSGASALNSSTIPKLNNNKLVDGEGHRVTKIVPSQHESSKRLSANLEFAPPAKPSQHESSKRHSDNLEVAPAKRQAIESSFGSPKPLSPSKKGALSRESSFKNSDMGKGKPIHPIPSSGGFSANNSQGIAHNTTVSAQNSSRAQKIIQSPRGTLFKSSSFSSGVNPRPKVQPIQDIPQKHNKLSRNTSINDIKKDGLVRTLNKSQSFKPGSTQSTSSGSKVKLLSSSPSRAEDITGLKAKERNIIERKSSFRSDRLVSPMTVTDQKVASRGETTAMLPSATNCRDLKSVPLDGKLDIASKQTSIPSPKGAESPSALGRADIRRQPSGLSRGVGHHSVNGNSADKRETQASQDVNVGNSSLTADRPPCSNNPDTILQLPQSQDYSNQDRKAREPTLRQPKPSISSGVRSIRCQKCKEIGHTADFCSNASLAAVGTSAARSSRELMDGSASPKDAAEAALLKRPAVCNKSRFPNQSDDSFMSISGLSSAAVSKDCLKNSMSSDGIHARQESFQTTSNRRTTTVTDVNQDALQLEEPLSAPTEEDSDEIASTDQNNLKPSARHLPSPVSSLSIPSKDSVIPGDFPIWKGGFKVQRSGTLVDYGGIRGHLSTFASPKVPEMVNKFPHEVLLKEVSRLSTWPKQFQNHLAEENIALFFFPEKEESHEGRRFNILMENMIKNDLALKGYFDGIEFLIFSSDQFSEFKRWNNLFFLWGVFRGKRVSSSDHISGSQKKFSGADLNVVPLEEASDTDAMADSQRECSSVNLDEDRSRYGQISERQEGKHTSVAVFSPAASDKQEMSSGQINVEQVEEFQEAGAAGSRTEEKIWVRLEDRRGCGLRNQEKLKDKVSMGSPEIPMDYDKLGSEKEPCNWASQSSKKRSCPLALDMVPQTASETSAGTSQPEPWGIRTGTRLVDGGEEKKTTKRLRSDAYGMDSYGERNEGLFHRHEERPDRALDNKVPPGISRTSEMPLFPMDLLGPPIDCRPGLNSIPVHILSSDDEDQLELDVPDLELALGADNKSPKQGVLPLFTVLGNRNKHRELPDSLADNSNDELSLSLSVPLVDKENIVKSVSKSPQPLPVKGHTDTPLFFLGGSSGL